VDDATASGTEPGLDVGELQETLLGQALEHAPLGAIVLDERGNFLAANRRATEVCGYGRRELLALGTPGLCADSDAHERLRAMAAGDLMTGSAEIRCKDGTVKQVDYRVGSTRVGGLPFFVGVFWE
jgi:PAS domain S-box-containing protein